MVVAVDEFYRGMKYRLEQLRKEKNELEEILAFYDKVLAAQEEAQQQTVVPEFHLPKDQLELRIDEGFPLIDRQAFQVDLDCSRRLFQNLCQLSLAENPVLAAAGKTLLQAVDSDRLDFAQLAAAVVQNDSEAITRLASDLQVTSPVLQTLAKLSLQPSLLAMAAVVAEQTTIDKWPYGYCPVCGELPAIAALVGEEGKREALCSFCGHFWQLPRIACPFCNTDKQEDLRYFYGEGEKIYRVHVCEKCGGYLKVVDTREGGDARGLAVDDVASGHLDLLAAEEGYQRKAPMLWGI